MTAFNADIALSRPLGWGSTSVNKTRGGRERIAQRGGSVGGSSLPTRQNGTRLVD